MRCGLAQDASTEMSLAMRRRLYAAPSMCAASWFAARPRYRVLRKLPTVLNQPKTSSTRLLIS